MTSQLEKPATPPEKSAPCHPSVRRWIYLRALLLGLLVSSWWILFVPESMMESGLKIALGIIAGIVATGSYLYNLRETLFPPKDAYGPDR